MSFRARLFLGVLAAVLLPLALLAWGVRREMDRRLAMQHAARVRSLSMVVATDLAAEARTVDRRLDALAADLASDSRFRLAAVAGDDAERRWLLDLAGDAMRRSGLAMLWIQDSAGRILSSGHFRNEFDRIEARVPRLVSGGEQGALLRAPTADGSVLVLAHADSFAVAGRRFTLTGGRAFDSATVARLAPDADLGVVLRFERRAPGAAAQPDDVAATFPIPYLDLLDRGPSFAWFDVVQRGGPLIELRRSVDRWFLGVFALTALAALAVSAWLAGRVSRPIRELAARTETIDLDRLDQDFSSDRTDEIGALSRLLGRMTDRLRASAGRLREAERRAAVGDVARQVNHDIKNGLNPIRHVLRHLTEVAEREPATLAQVFGERRGTLESSVAYLDDLARNYAKLSPRVDRERCDLNALASEVARNAGNGSATVETRLAAGLPPVRGDAVVLRRIVENLVGNAVDALDGKPGSVTIATEPAGEGVRLSVIDTGRGMTAAELDRAFDDFYTTKAGGTGLGLSVVRRLVADLGGALRVETEPGAGTRFHVELS